MKYFAGIALPETLKDVLSGSQINFTKYRWEQRDNLHLTLFYFGTVEQDVYSGLLRKLGQINKTRFLLSLDKTGFFSRKTNNTILWAGIAESQPLRDLQSLVEDAAVSFGWQREKRDFSPHVTLLKSSRNSPDEFNDYRDHAAGIFPLEWQVDDFQLFSSEKGDAGMDYRVVEEFRLGI